MQIYGIFVEKECPTGQKPHILYFFHRIFFVSLSHNFICPLMNEDDKKLLSKDSDGLLTYEYIANHISSIDDDLDYLIDNMMRVDLSGQFIVSAARYLFAIDAEHYNNAVSRLITAAIEKDREHRYIGDLLPLWGADYQDQVEELSKTDNNFRRIYKRLYPTGI